MREVKRKRPWETQQGETERNLLDTFLHQLVLSTFITIGIFMALNTENNTQIKNFINTHLTKDIALQDVQSIMDYVKDTLSEYGD
ncbi:hypothetical protein [Cellulosilyticum sp. I15G10I2]|uniref:hypothetical protein n=1 Tax=Cellulosilyticum sp. I15G10I2 TaxID=1892843 RepID=UPI00085BD1C6|nr:hypothetical protein [Cellulosilyticum sp. I15G10I2]